MHRVLPPEICPEKHTSHSDAQEEHASRRSTVMAAGSRKRRGILAESDRT